MGDVAEMYLDGTFCESCGVLMEGLIPEEGNTLKPSPGYPRQCEDCKNEGW